MIDVLEKLPILHGLKRARLSELALAGTVREYKGGTSSSRQASTPTRCT
jgi:hypothetical protein